MADISLRVYLEEVDGMIDGNRADEAVAHLKHVLGIYPKNLEAYRLLAKALLEKNRHLDAADVFQRVLSSVPDDFISHIGMAVVREDEGNLDAAIWHMERAFEVQPSNPVVQDQLRNLYARRIGAEPPKLRLTRGALARMYERGDLHPQAIAELRAALKDEPGRLDLRVMLAASLWRSRQRAEAAATAAKVLEVLPFCKEANRILASAWNESGRSEEAQNFRARLEALDPYEAYSDPALNGDGAQHVPPESVRIPRLERGAADAAPDLSRPDWMDALGIQYDQAPAAAAPSAPDWLDNLGQPAGAEATSPAAAPGGTGWLSVLRGEETAPAEGSGAEAPDWLQGATAAQPAPADSGDWLSGLASAAAPIGGSPGASRSEDWLQDVFGGSPTSAPAESAAAEPESPPSWMTKDISESRPGGAPPGRTGMTAWLNTLEESPEIGAGPAATEESASEGDWVESGAFTPSTSATDSEIPDWLKGGEDTTPPAGVESGAPDWMRAGSTETEPAAPAAEVPDWLRGGAAGSDESPAAPAVGELPDWLRGGSPAEPSPAAEDEAPAWLAGSAPVSEPAPAAEAGDLPDWLRGGETDVEAAAPEDGEPPAWLSTQAAEPASAPSAGLPDWLNASAAPAPAAQADEDISEWLNSAPSSAMAGPAPAPAPEDIPTWLTPAEPVPAAESGSVPDWLKPSTGELKLAATLPPAEAPIMSDDEKAAEMSRADHEIPDWMKAAGWAPRDPTIPLDSAEEGALVEEDAEPEEAEIPDWIKAMKPPEGPQPTLKATGEAPDWLKSALEGGTADETESAASAGAVSDWLATNEPAPTASRTGVTDWLDEKKSPPPSFPEAEAEAQPASPHTGLTDWLKTPATSPGNTVALFLKDKESPPAPPSAAGAKEAELATKRETPDWLRKPAGEAGKLPPESTPSPDSAAPDWLRTPAEAEPATQPDWVRQPVEETPGDTAASMDMSSIEDPLAWLESLAAKQGANPEELVTKPSERPTEQPEWVRASAAQPEMIEPIEIAPPPVETPPEPEPPAPAKVAPVAAADTTASMDMSVEASLAWLESLAAKQGASPEELVSKPETRAEELPEWIRAEMTAPAAPVAVEPEPEPVSAVETPAEKPDWLKQMEAEADQYEATLGEAEPLSTPPPAVAQPPEPEPAPMVEEPVAWTPPSLEPEPAPEPEPAAPEIPAWLAQPAASEPEPAWTPMSAVPPAPPPAPAVEPIAAKAEPAPRPAKAPKAERPKREKKPRAPRPKRSRASKLRSTEPPEIVLAVARQRLAEGNFDSAIEVYVELIASAQILGDIAADLEAAILTNPGHPELLRTLGDAYMRDNQLQRALDSYKRALQLL